MLRLYSNSRQTFLHAPTAQKFNIPVVSHLTCVGSTVDQLREYLARAKSQSIDAIMALRGDPPKGEDKFVAPNLKRKVDAGADAIVTQLFYDNTDFYRFRDLCESKGITTPVVPGLLPVTSLSQIQRITDLCGAKLPANFIATLESDSSEVGQFKAGVDHAVTQTEDLVANGVAGLHYYVLNKSDATAKILERVSL